MVQAQSRSLSESVRGGIETSHRTPVYPTITGPYESARPAVLTARSARSQARKIENCFRLVPDLPFFAAAAHFLRGLHRFHEIGGADRHGSGFLALSNLELPSAPDRHIPLPFN